MGCDIHMVLEQKVEVAGQGEKWVGLHAFPYHPTSGGQSLSDYSFWRATDRNYALFNALAGVRGEGPAEPKGVPDDASDLAQLMIANWRGDGHSHSWMLMREALPIFNLYQFNVVARRLQGETPDRLAMSTLDEFGLGDDDPDLTKYRLVFWFDN